MKNKYTTPRVHLKTLTVSDAAFILKLLNTSEWINYIGDRNIHTEDEARTYIKKIIADPATSYWVVYLRYQRIPIGMVTFIKKEYLNSPDVGFALLPEYTRQGYAYEATSTLLNDLSKNPKLEEILATTTRDNLASVQLLNKLGFEFVKEINTENESLDLYAATTDSININHITRQFFDVFTNVIGKKPEWDSIYRICFEGAMVMKKKSNIEVVYTVTDFIEDTKNMLSNGGLIEFEETEANHETKIAERLASRYSKISKTGYLNGKYFLSYGHKFFQFVKTEEGWRICAVIWEEVN